ncbi:MAG: ABC transporter permease subunit, partial [Nocardioidaceae bacterium]|nr:ABC transporter permease subunit [Nocardioidaceae bacterium]
MSDVYRVTRAELFKLVRRPSGWVLLGAAVVLSQVFGYLVPYLSYRSGGGDGEVVGGATPEQLLAGTLPDQLVANSIGGFPVFVGALALVLGAVMFGGEHNWGTVKTLLTQRPGRGRILVGRLLALVVALLVATGVMFTTGAASATAIALAEGEPVVWPGTGALASGFAAGWLILAMWGVLGAVLGETMRGVALPIGLGVVWVLGVENLLSALAGSMLSALQPVRDVLPGVNAGSLAAAVMPDGLVEP